MKKYISLFLTALLLSALTACAVPANSDPSLKSAKAVRLNPETEPDADIPAPISEAYASLNDFTQKLTAEFARQNDSKANTLISPLSAYLAMSMVKEGASGDTLMQMNNVMGEIAPYDILSLLSHLNTLDRTTLSIADSVWLDESFTPRVEYLDALAKYYLAECYSAPLAHAEKDVNSWIEARTNGLIKNMLDESALDNAIMALVNTIYMDAKWQSEFDPASTYERDFTNADGTKTVTEFMRKTAYLNVIETASVIGAVLPYNDGSLAFVALMPTDNNAAVSAVFDEVTSLGGWNQAINSAIGERIKLFLPKFKQSSSVSLSDLLKSIGIEDAFDRAKADFNGIADEIYIENVYQNAKLKLDEAGTEAAAATVVVASPTSAMPSEDEPREIILDRPFAFAVVDTVTGAVLFTGEHNFAE